MEALSAAVMAWMTAHPVAHTILSIISGAFAGGHAMGWWSRRNAPQIQPFIPKEGELTGHRDNNREYF